jgi:hypothetical protein
MKVKSLKANQTEITAGKVRSYNGGDLFCPRITNGFWFSNSPTAAERFGDVSQHYLSINRLADLNNPRTLDQLVKNTKSPVEAQYSRDELLEDPDQGLTDWFWQNALIETAKTEGFDAITFVDETSIDGTNAIQHNSTVVFYSAQIKPAYPVTYDDHGNATP